MSPASQGADLSQIGRTVPLRRSHASFGDFVALMKPRVMSLVVFTALVGLLVAPGHLDPLIGFVALLCITAGVRTRPPPAPSLIVSLRLLRLMAAPLGHARARACAPRTRPRAPP